MNNSSEGQKTRLSYLDLYKGIVIIFVIFTHYSHYFWNDRMRQIWLFPFWIDMAVPIFMVITGYVSALSFQKKIKKFYEAYNPRDIICKWLRFLIPFLIVFIPQSVALYLLSDEKFSVGGLLYNFISGGKGPGSYYFPIMIQVVLMMPLIWAAVRKFYLKGLAMCFAVNVFYEAFKRLIGMSDAVYRLIAFRYIFILAFGCYLYIKFSEKRKDNPVWIYIAGGLGVVYLILYKYVGLTPFITEQWTGTSVFAVLYILPIMYLLMKPNKLHCWFIELLGKASFNIFLVQMLFYWSVSAKIDSMLPGLALKAIGNIVICCALGVLFYKIENPITQKIIKAIKKK